MDEQNYTQFPTGHRGAEEEYSRIVYFFAVTLLPFKGSKDQRPPEAAPQRIKGSNGRRRRPLKGSKAKQPPKAATRRIKGLTAAEGGPAKDQAIIQYDYWYYYCNVEWDYG